MAVKAVDVANLSSVALERSDCVVPSLSWECRPLTQQLCAQLQSEWNGLADAASERNFFQLPSFIASSLQLLSPQSAKLVVVRKESLLIGIVILRHDRGYAKLPVPFWRSALHHEQFLGTPLVRAGYEEDFVEGLCAWLDDAPRDCCFLKLSMISAEGPLALAIARHCSHDQRQFLIANRFERAAIVPMGQHASNADELLSKSRRKSIRKAAKRLGAEGEVSIERLSDAQQVEAWTAHFLEMENTGWKHENGSSILSCEHETALYQAMIGEAFESNDLHFSRLCLDDQPIAYTLDIAGYCLKSAIDQRYRKFSPGVLMEYDTLKHYLKTDDFALVDSCSAPDNSMLNELWPDRKAIMDMAIARKGAGYTLVFQAMQTIKSLLSKADGTAG